MRIKLNEIFFNLKLNVDSDKAYATLILAKDLEL